MKAEIRRINPTSTGIMVLKDDAGKDMAAISIISLNGSDFKNKSYLQRCEEIYGLIIEAIRRSGLNDMAPKPVDFPEIGKPYRHFKGEVYVPVALSRHSETLEIMVNYIKKDDLTNTMWSRPIAMWDETIDEKGTRRFMKVE